MREKIPVSRVDHLPQSGVVERDKKERVKNRLTDTLSRLVSFQTVADGNHKEEFRGLFDYVSQRVEQVSQETGRQFVAKEWNNNGHISTIITPKDESISDEQTLLHPKIAMLIRADVVDVEGDLNLFSTRKDEENLYGRGVYDMKQGLAIGLDLLPTMPVGGALVITPDEERGGENGAEYLAKEIGFRPEFLIVLDGQKSENLSLGAKGVWHYKVSFNSLLNEGGHGSRYEDYSANELAMDFRNALRTHYPWRYSNSPAGTTCNVGVMQGGVGTNKVAQNAFLQVDMRVSNEEERIKGRVNVENALQQIALDRFHEVYGEVLPIAIESLKDENGAYRLSVVSQNGEKYSLATVENLVEIPVYSLDKNDHRIQRFAQLVQEQTGQPVQVNDKDTGAHDGSNWPDVQAIVYMPKGGGAHKSSEWVNIESLVDTREALNQLMQEELVA